MLARRGGVRWLPSCLQPRLSGKQSICNVTLPSVGNNFKAPASCALCGTKLSYSCVYKSSLRLEHAQHPAQLAVSSIPGKCNTRQQSKACSRLRTTIKLCERRTPSGTGFWRKANSLYGRHALTLKFYVGGLKLPCRQKCRVCITHHSGNNNRQPCFVTTFKSSAAGRSVGYASVHHSGNNNWKPWFWTNTQVAFIAAGRNAGCASLTNWQQQSKALVLDQHSYCIHCCRQK